MKINFDKLKIERPTLYAKIAKEISHEYVGEREFFPDVLGEEIVEELKAWQAAPGTHEKHCPCEECFNKYVSENNRKEKGRLALVAQQKAAEARIMEYVAQGLANTEANREIFMTAWKTHPALKVIEIPTVQLVDAVIALVRDKLTWQKPTPPTPAPAPEPVVILSDGSEQLPIDAVPSSRYTVAQLQDLDARQRALKAGEGTLAPLENGEPRLPLGTKPNPSHSVAQRRDLELRTARVWARQSGSHGGSFFSSDSQVR